MRLVLALLLAFGCVKPACSLAGPSLTLAWADCLAGAGTHNQVFGCGSNSVEFLLFPAFELATSVDSVFQLEVVIDLQHSSVTLPDWWRLDPGQCRADQAIADVAFAGTGCMDPWSGVGISAIQGYLTGPPGRSSSQARILIAATVPSSQAVTLQSGVTYAAARVRLRTGNSTTCAGCSGSACLVLNSIQLQRLAVTGPGTITLTVPPNETANWVTWQGGVGADCATVPVRNQTWGAVKSLYR